MTDYKFDTSLAKPCPFRGGHYRKKLVMHHINSKHYKNGLYAVKCEICGVRGMYALSEETAIEEWNER